MSSVGRRALVLVALAVFVAAVWGLAYAGWHTRGDALDCLSVNKQRLAADEPLIECRY